MPTVTISTISFTPNTDSYLAIWIKLTVIFRMLILLEGTFTTLANRIKHEGDNKTVSTVISEIINKANHQYHILNSWIVSSIMCDANFVVFRQKIRWNYSWDKSITFGWDGHRSSATRVSYYFDRTLIGIIRETRAYFVNETVIDHVGHERRSILTEHL